MTAESGPAADAAARGAARAAWVEARDAAAALAASGRLGEELTPALELGLVPQIDAAIADLDDGLPLGAVLELSAPMAGSVAALAGPLGLAPALRPVRDGIRRGLDALGADA